MSLKNKPRRKSSSGKIFIIMIISYDPDWSHVSVFWDTRWPKSLRQRWCGGAGREGVVEQEDRQLTHNILEVERDKEDHSTPWLHSFSSIKIHLFRIPFWYLETFGTNQIPQSLRIVTHASLLENFKTFQMQIKAIFFNMTV